MTEKLSRCLRLLAAVLLLCPLLLLLTGLHVLAEAALTPEGCSCPRVVDASGNPLVVPPGKQPVLLVHGLGFPPLGLPFTLPYGAPSQWNGTGGLADELENNAKYSSDYVVGRLDYSDLHDKWVTDAGPGDKSIAQLTAAAIKCMAKNTGKKVIAVGHSMGGLAIQAALGEDPNAAENVAGIVSIGTPWKGVPRERIDAMINFAMGGVQLAKVAPPLAGNVLSSWLANNAENYLKQVQNSSAIAALELNSDGTPSKQVQSLPLIKAGIPILPIAGVVTAVQSDDLKKQTLPLTDLSTGQQVNLIGTTVTVFDNQKAATIATDSKSSAGADPFVGVDSALYPNAVGPIWASQPFQCAGNGFSCWTDSQHVIGDYHSTLPSDPAVAQKVLPAIDEWRTKADKAAIDKLAMDPGALGECSSPPSIIPTPVPTPQPPKVTDPPNTSGMINLPKTLICKPGEDLVGGQCVLKQQPACQAGDSHCLNNQQVCRPDQHRDRDGHCYDITKCDHDQYWDHGQCKPIPACDHNQVADGHGGCIEKPTGPQECRHDQVRGKDGKCDDRQTDCPHGQVRDVHGGCSDIPNNGNQGSGSNGSCPNGMVRISPETDTSSGCAPANGKQGEPQKPEQPQKQGQGEPQKQEHKDGHKQDNPQTQENPQKQDHPNKQEKKPEPNQQTTHKNPTQEQTNSGQSGSDKSGHKKKCDPDQEKCAQR